MSDTVSQASAVIVGAGIVGNSIACVHRMFPLAADHTIIECDWLYSPDVVASGADLSSSVELFHRVNQQDFAACEQCQPGRASRGYAQGGALVPSEHHLSEFHARVRAGLGEGAGQAGSASGSVA